MAQLKSRKWLAGLAVSAACAVFAEEQYTDERYQVILDRAPFGTDPALVNADSAANNPAQTALAKDLRLCMLLEGQNGEVRAGFQNLKAGPNDRQSIILLVGESFKGAKLLDIDIASANATLERDGQSVLFKLEKGSEPVAAPAPAQAGQPPPTARRFGGGFRSPEPPQPQPRPEPVPEITPEQREEMRARMREYQMEVIRQGMPPLPVPLTQEMDDQLVAEGVLPPPE